MSDKRSVSVLFSEPKIPQCARYGAPEGCHDEFQCSSASRKFLNRFAGSPLRFLRRCFSALQRAENSSMAKDGSIYIQEIECFSALQRAENSSISIVTVNQHYFKGFQCSSASRKFLNCLPQLVVLRRFLRFSALQRAENSSIFFDDDFARGLGLVSVLFSEPKIPQSSPTPGSISLRTEFQCSSASRKFLNHFAPP